MRISDWSSDVCSSDLRTTSSMSPTRATGPSQAAAIAAMSPMATKGGRLFSRRAAHARAATSGPTPAGSPMVTAIGCRLLGSGMRSAIFDHGIPAQVAQIALSPLVDLVLQQFLLDLLEVRGGRGLRHVAAAEHKDAHALVCGAERLRRLADLQA